MLIAQWITPLGNVVIDHIHAIEIGMEHVGGREDMLTHIVSIG